MSIAFLALAGPGFDLAFAQIQSVQAWVAIAAAGLPLVGSENLLMDLASVDTAIADCQAQNPSMVLVLFASFADNSMIERIVNTLKLPLILWAIPEDRTGGRLRLESFSGMNLSTHGLKRAGIPYEYIYAAPDNAEAIQRIQNYVVAARVVRKLKQAKIGRIGENPVGFDTSHFNSDNLKHRLGLEIHQRDLESFFDDVRQIEPEQVGILETELKETLLSYDTVNREEAHGTLATFLALKAYAQEHHLQGMAVRCWPEFFGNLGCAACGAMSMLNNAHIPATCEADINGAISQLILQSISGDVAFSTAMVDFDIVDDTTVVWHCGLAPVAMADPDFAPEVTSHPNHKKGLLMQFPLKAGRVTLARLSEVNGDLRLVIAGGEMLKRPISFNGTSGVIRFDSGTEFVMNTLLHEGLEHKISLCYGDYQEVLAALANILDMPLIRL